MIVSTTLKTPIGTLRIAASEKGVTAVDFPSRGRSQAARYAASRARENEKGGAPEDTGRASRTAAQRHLASAVRQLTEYFSGKRDGFDLDIFMTGTDFEAKVWRRLARIPHGETCTYAEVARDAGAPGAARAAGGAIGKNPVPIIVPCHRVIGANGSLTGFGGGLDRKSWLLAHETKQGRLP
jgi:O-6-methylguanine DNA methyltransferase